MIDTHTHLYMEEFSGEETEIVMKAIASGVDKLIFPGVSMESTPSMVSLYKKFPDNVRICIGIHPTELKSNWREELSELEKYLDLPGIAGVGETGIDLHWDQTNLEIQKEAFSEQIRWASKLDLPLIIHCRDGLDAALEVIEEFSGSLPKMIFHSFTSSIEDVKRIREICDPYFGINGVVTFKNAKLLQNSLFEIGLNRIVLETDSPYLSPSPFRGERNDSSKLPIIAMKVSEILGTSLQEVETITDNNAKKIFKF